MKTLPNLKKTPASRTAARVAMVRRFFVWSRDYYESASQMFPRDDQKHGEFEVETEDQLPAKLREAGLDPSECRWEPVSA